VPEQLDQQRCCGSSATHTYCFSVAALTRHAKNREAGKVFVQVCAPAAAAAAAAAGAAAACCCCLLLLNSKLLLQSGWCAEIKNYVLQHRPSLLYY
jgi:hypothetical protein